ncbi:MAG: GMC family oxidoreductase N-terminal domain-containing protein [Actinobacteria bacterium]|nr:GMC family oxidoreductase N-terminal domain-containing protein [Actinomycetota bacterium]
MKKRTDYLVVGSGAGGATVAAGLARTGAQVTVLERGPDYSRVGNHLFTIAVLDGHGFLKSNEGMGVARALVTGGSTLLTCGTACRPPAGVFEKHAIDLGPYLEETERDLRVTTLPDETIGEAALRLVEVGDSMGMHWRKLDKFIDPEKCEPRFCNCMLGCPKGAKWTSREYLDEAKRHGAEVLPRVTVDEVLVSGGAAVGIRGWEKGVGPVEIESGVTILAAGGMGTPVIMQRSGIEGAGEGFFCDPLVFTVGFHPTLEGGFDPPMTVGTFDFWESDGFVLSPVVDPWGSFGIEILRARPAFLGRWARFPHAMGIMTKAKDELSGRVNIDETFSKVLTHKDRSVLDKGIGISRRMLVEAGCPSDSIFVTKVRGAHPGGTCRIGEVVDTDLKTGLDNLYVCDASVIPDSLAAPVVLTLVALGKRLVEHLRP